MARPVILCVDDERIILSSLKAQLHNNLGSEFEIEIAESAEEALEIFDELSNQQIQIPLVIADQIMPVMKGDEFLSLIKQRSPHTLTIMLTGQATAEAVGQAVNKANLFRYISKPWDENDLILTIRSALDSYHHHRSCMKQNAYQLFIHKTLNLALSTLNLKQQISKALEYLLTIPCLNPPGQGAIYFKNTSHVFNEHELSTPNQAPTSSNLICFKKACSRNESNEHDEIKLHPQDIPDYSAPLLLKKNNSNEDFYSYPILLENVLIGLLTVTIDDSFEDCKEIQNFLLSFAQTLANIYRLSASHHVLRQTNLKLERHREELENLVKERTEELTQSLNQQEEINEKLRKANSELEYFATTDSLTGLLNRRHFFTLAEEAREKLQFDSKPVTVAMIDIDFFKQINDEYGHNTGDKLLKKVANAIKTCFTEQSLVCRFGGEEFAILIPDKTESEAFDHLQQVRQKVSDTKLTTPSGDVSVTVSIGLSEVENQERTLDNALSRADKTLYASKEYGRNRVTRFHGDRSCN